MKIKFILPLIFLVFSNSNAADIVIKDGQTYFKLFDKSTSSFSFINSVSEIGTSIVKKADDSFIKINIDKYVSNSEIGHAELPVLNKLISIPENANYTIEVLNKEYEIISLSEYNTNNYHVFPKQPSISKSENADDVPFYYDIESYSNNDFVSKDIITIEKLGRIRGVNLARMSVAPVMYNPVSNELKIITKIEVRISFSGIDFEQEKQIKEKYFSNDFEPIFNKCINYISNSHKDVITTYPVKYVIVSDPLFQSVLQPFIEWKRKKGFLVIEAYTNDPLVGNTTSSIHTFLNDMYDNASVNNPAPTYLLLVGDINEVPSFNMGGHVSDMYYCEFDGNGDFFPEMYYGRFSGTTTEHIENQVTKTLNYEKYLLSDFSYLDEVLLVAGVDQSMAPVYGNGQINYGTDNYFNSAHNLTIHNYLYGSGTPITSDMSAASAAIISDFSDGVAFANYTAHCGSSGWSDPSFETSDVSSLQNFDEYGLMIGNCCQSVKFEVPVCFGESVLRAEDKGAVGYIGGSNNTYWDEDYWWAVGNTSNITANPSYTGTDLGVYDCWIHENGESRSDWFFTQGQMIHSGNLAVTQAGGSDQYYWEIYHLMGDPSLMPYLGIPSLLSVSHSGAIPLGSSTLTVTTEEDAYVALSMNGILLDAQLAGISGIVNLNFPNLTNIGNIDIVVTKQFRQPYISSISVISSNSPFVVYNDHVIIDINGNNNALADYNEYIELDVEVHNLGAQSAQSLNVVLSSNDPYINIIDSIDYVASINANNTLILGSPFSLQIAALVPDQHLASLQLQITDNLGNVWNSNFSLLLNSPVLTDVGIYFDDQLQGNGNGKLDAGETLNVQIDVMNVGHAEITNINSFISCNSNFVSISSPVFLLPNLAANQQQNISYTITIDPNAPIGHPVLFNFDLTDGIYAHSNSISETIGVIDEDYETGDFTSFNWNNDPSYPWIISSNNPYEGTSCSRSALNQPDQTDSKLSIDLNVLMNGEISFYKKMSSEQDYDFLKFRINGQKMDEWSGIDSDWSFVSFAVNQGMNTFTWEYDKDWSASDGQDCAYVDYIVFPPIDINNTTELIKYDSLWKVFPNPSIGKFFIEFYDNQTHEVLIYNINGKLIDSKISNDRVSFDLTEKSSGLYHLKILPENIVFPLLKN